MTDGMGTAWTPDPARRRRSTDPSLRPGHTIEAQALIDIHTKRLMEDIEPWRVAEFQSSVYFDALDDLRKLVNLPPLERP